MAIVDFEPAGQSSSFLRLERFVKRRHVVGVEIIRHQADFGGLRVTLIEHMSNNKTTLVDILLKEQDTFAWRDIPAHPPTGTRIPK
jgi:hypothetical protein